MQWIKLGDSNTSYFFAQMKERKTQNQIKVFTTAAGNVISYPKDIKTEVVGFYKTLLGQAVSHIPGIHPAVIRNGPTLTRTQQFQFIQPFAAKDVETTLKEISNDKYLRINRFNSHFFKQSWSVIGKEVTEAVLHFFATNTITQN